MARRRSTALAPLPPRMPLDERYAREMGYRGPQVSRDTGRHPDPVVATLRDMQRDAEVTIDWPKVFVGGAALAALGWFLWRNVVGPKDAAAAEPEHIDPTPGLEPAKPAPKPAPSNPTAAAVRVGDMILVRGDFLRSQLPGASLGQLPLVQMRVTSVAATSVIAVIQDPRVGTFADNPLVVPHSEIDAVSKPGDVPPPSPSPSPAAPSGPIFLDGPSVPVRTGKRYRARLELSTFEAMAANEQLVAQQFASLGFEDVQAFHKASELPSDWPSETTKGDLARVWFVQGKWPKDDASFPRPPQLARVWEG